MSIGVSDKFSNLNDHKANIAKILGKSKDRHKVFEAIYRGKKAIKSQLEVQKATNLSPMRVLQLAGQLYANEIIDQVKIDGRITSKKIRSIRTTRHLFYAWQETRKSWRSFRRR